jgi:LysR family hydrogen peroxide-inducible transcriptional activator
MELHQLRYVLAVGRAGNFSRAAEMCHVSQPSLSQQIQKLEEELGERLFTRLKREAVPTAAGRALLERAARILREVEEAQRELNDFRTEVRGTVNLGVLPTIAPHLLPQVMVQLRREFPAIEVTVHENTTTTLLAKAAACELDFAVLSLPIVDDRFAVETLFNEELLLAVPPKHKLAKRRQVKLEDVEEEPFILLQEGHCLGDQALKFCDRHKCHPPVIFRTAQLETIQALVATGMGVSLIPKMACQKDRAHQPVYLSLADPKPQRAIAVLWRKEHAPGRAARAVLAVMRKSVGKAAGTRHGHRC